MKKSLVQLLAFLAPLASSANPTPLDDLTRLQQSIISATNRLEASLNTTAALNTSDIIQSIGYRVGASMANLGCVKSTRPTVGIAGLGSATNKTMVNANVPSDAGTLHRPWNQTSVVATNTTHSFEAAYNEYTANLSTLAESVMSRGRASHSEFDYPVQRQLASLTRAVYNYGKCCRGGDFISSDSAIQTWKAEKSLTDAQTAWENGWENLATTAHSTTGDRKGKKLRRDSVHVSRVRRSDVRR